MADEQLKHQVVRGGLGGPGEVFQGFDPIRDAQIRQAQRLADTWMIGGLGQNLLQHLHRAGVVVASDVSLGLQDGQLNQGRQVAGPGRVDGLDDGRAKGVQSRDSLGVQLRFGRGASGGCWFTRLRSAADRRQGQHQPGRRVKDTSYGQCPSHQR